MTFAFPPFTTLAIAILLGYLLGALPIADRISRLYGVDIFSTGTGLAGASNVRRKVGTRPAILVLMGDVTKGVLTILVAKFVGLQESWLILPSVAAIIGHWKSVFTRFRGGDGNAILGGLIIGLFPAFALISIVAGALIGLVSRRLQYSSLLNIVGGYLTLAALTVVNNGNLTLLLGVGGLACMVLAYASFGHMKRRRTGNINWIDIEDAEDAPEQPDFRS